MSVGLQNKNNCCACLNPSYNLKSINTKTSDSITLLDMIFYLIAYPIENYESNEYKDGKICTNCEKTLTLSYYFKKMLIVSNIELCSLQNSNNNHNEIETVLIKEEFVDLDYSDNDIFSSDIVEYSQNVFNDVESVILNFESDTLNDIESTNDSFSEAKCNIKEERNDMNDKLIEDMQYSNKCSTCDIIFSDTSEYLSHCEDLHSVAVSGEQIICSICYKWILVKNISAHLMVCQKEKPKQISNEKSHEDHPSESLNPQKKMASVGKYFKCKLCGIKIIKSFMSSHLAMHYIEPAVKTEKNEMTKFYEGKPKQVFNVESCEENPNGDLKHKKNTHRVAEECTICGIRIEKCYMSLHLSTTHNIEHALEVLKPEKNKNYRKKPEKRIRKPQKKPINSICTLCGKSLTPGRIKEHMQSHANIKQKCPLCEKQYSTHGGVIEHIRTFHKNDKKYPCKYCGEKFLYRISRKNHENAIHNGIKQRVNCTICNKKLASKSSLVIHIRAMHTHEKPFQCDKCEKNFVSRMQLKEHQIVHSNEKKFKCDICLNRFKSRKALTAHMRIHTGDKKYVCPVCSQSFLYIQVLRSHMKKHPGLTIPPPGTILSHKMLNKDPDSQKYSYLLSQKAKSSENTTTDEF